MLLIAVFAISVFIGLYASYAYGSAAIWTDKPDYVSFETVKIYGSGFAANVYYDIPVVRPDGNIVRGDGSSTFGWDAVQADAYGKFTYFYKLDGVAGLYEVRVYGSPWSGSLDQTPLATTTFTDAPPAVNLDQLKNGPATTPLSPGEWVNGNLNEQTAHYVEGYSIAYRAVMTDLPTATSITLTLGYDIRHSGRNAIDYLTHYNRIDSPLHVNVFGHAPETINPLDGVAGVSPTITTFAIPAPSSVGSLVPGQPTNSFNSLPAGERMVTLFGGTITSISYFSQGSLTASNSETQISITFTVDSSTAVLAWGGHIASRLDWGYTVGVPNSAGGISGSPYHMRLIQWTLSNIGQQDRSLSAVAVYAPPGMIIVRKITLGGVDTFWFDGAGTEIPAGFDFFSITTTVPEVPAIQIFTDVKPGTYTVVEQALAGWDLTDITISDPDGGSSEAGSTATLDVDSGETVTVTFTNTMRGRIVVDKITVPAADPQSFSFALTGGPDSYSASFGLTDAQTPWDSGWLRPGSGYFVTETVPGGWGLTGVTVNGVASSNGASLMLNPGQILYVNFTDTKYGHIIVHKTTVPAGDPAVFTFDPDYQVSNFILSGGQQYDSGAIVLGTYLVQELALAGWDLTGLTVTDPDLGSSVDIGTGTAAIDLDAGETVHVYYTNTIPPSEGTGSIVIVKITLGGAGTFDFVGADTMLPPGFSSFSITTATPEVAASTGFADVKPGTYTVVEQALAGWDLTDITISDPDGGSSEAGSTATLDVDSGETVTVTFTNTMRGRIVVDKITVPAADPQSFSFALTGGPDNIMQIFSLTDTATPHDSGWIKAGTYAAYETVPAGWDLTNVLVSDGSPTSAISLQAGETVTVTFTDTRTPVEHGKVTVVKDAVPDNPDDFSYSGDLGIFTLDDDTDPTYSNTEVFLTVVSGQYDITEGPEALWQVTSIAIYGDDDYTSGNTETRTARVYVDPGEQITITFTNSPAPVSPPVGGKWNPIDKTGLPPHWVIFALLIAVTMMSFTSVRRIRKSARSKNTHARCATSWMHECYHSRVFRAP